MNRDEFWGPIMSAVTVLGVLGVLMIWLAVAEMIGGSS